MKPLRIAPVTSNEFAYDLMLSNALAFAYLRVPQPTIIAWSQRLVNEQAEVVRLNGGWLSRNFRWGARQPQVYLIRLGSSVWGIVRSGEAWCDEGKRWSNGLITLRDLERDHPEIFRLWEASDILQAWTAADKPRALGEVAAADLMTSTLELI